MGSQSTAAGLTSSSKCGGRRKEREKEKGIHYWSRQELEVDTVGPGNVWVRVQALWSVPARD